MPTTLGVLCGLRKHGLQRVASLTAPPSEILNLRQSAKSVDKLFCFTDRARTSAQGIASGFRALPGPGEIEDERKEGSRQIAGRPAFTFRDVCFSISIMPRQNRFVNGNRRKMAPSGRI
jgi:hypothetical protein